MPQPTSPASVSSMQYWPLRQRLLMPMAQPFRNWIGREMLRGSASLMAGLLGPLLRRRRARQGQGGRGPAARRHRDELVLAVRETALVVDLERLAPGADPPR